MELNSLEQGTDVSMSMCTNWNRTGSIFVEKEYKSTTLTQCWKVKGRTNIGFKGSIPASLCNSETWTELEVKFFDSLIIQIHSKASYTLIFTSQAV